MKIRIKILILTVSLAVVTSCVRKKLLQKSTQKLEDSFVLIPGGYLQIIGSPEDMPRMPESLNGDFRNPYVKADSFYLCKYEETNQDYQEFLYSILRPKNNLFAECYHYSRAGDTAFYHQMYPDSNVWTTQKNGDQGLYDLAYREYYFKHPVYSKYPVVGISYQQAFAYCSWLTEMSNKNPDRTFKKVLFRLPTKAEWEFAASGGKSHQKFPWQGDNLLDDNGKPKAHFTLIDQSSVYKYTYDYINYQDKIAHAEVIRCGPVEREEYYEYTKPVDSFKPGYFGLYNMAGNVEEMVAEKGLTKGGSWNDAGFYLKNEYTQQLDST